MKLKLHYMGVLPLLATGLGQSVDESSVRVGGTSKILNAYEDSQSSSKPNGKGSGSYGRDYGSAKGSSGGNGSSEFSIITSFEPETITAVETEDGGAYGDYGSPTWGITTNDTIIPEETPTSHVDPFETPEISLNTITPPTELATTIGITTNGVTSHVDPLPSPEISSNTSTNISNATTEPLTSITIDVTSHVVTSHVDPYGTPDISANAQTQTSGPVTSIEPTNNEVTSHVDPFGTPVISLQTLTPTQEPVTSIEPTNNEVTSHVDPFGTPVISLQTPTPTQEPVTSIEPTNNGVTSHVDPFGTPVISLQTLTPTQEPVTSINATTNEVTSHVDPFATVAPSPEPAVEGGSSLSILATFTVADITATETATPQIYAVSSPRPISDDVVVTAQAWNAPSDLIDEPVPTSSSLDDGIVNDSSGSTDDWVATAAPLSSSTSLSEPTITQGLSDFTFEDGEDVTVTTITTTVFGAGTISAGACHASFTVVATAPAELLGPEATPIIQSVEQKDIVEAYIRARVELLGLLHKQSSEEMRIQSNEEKIGQLKNVRGHYEWLFYMMSKIGYEC